MMFQIKLSKLTLGWTAYLLITPVFIRKVSDFIIYLCGKNGLALVLWIVFACGGSLAFISFYKSCRSFRRTLLFLGIFALGLFYAAQFRVVEERAHLINFGLLGWWVVQDLTRLRKFWLGIGMALVYCLIIASLEETIQIWLPDRVACLHDVILGFQGAIWGSCLFLSLHSRKHTSNGY